MESESVTKPPDRFPEWTHRPLTIAAVGLILGLVAGPLNLGLGLIAMLLAFRTKAMWAFGFAVIGFTLRPPAAVPVVTKSDFKGTVIIAAPPRRTPYATLVVVTTENHRLRMQLPPGATVTKGAVYAVRGQMRPSSDSYAESDIRQGIEGVLVPQKTGWKEVEPGPQFFAKAEELSLSFHRYLERFPTTEAALMEALVTGNDGYLDGSAQINLIKAGVLHLVAASGMQVQIFAVVLALLLRMIPIPRWCQILILLVVLAFYAAIAGLAVSVLRAVVMASIEALSPYFRRTYDSLSSLSFAAIILLIANPYWAMSPGFYLSFGGMLAIILAGAALRKHKPWERESGKSLAAAVVTTPTTIYFFGSATPYGAVATLALSYWASALMLLSLIGFTVERIGLWFIQRPIDFVCQAVARAFLDGVASFAALPGSYVTVSQVDPAWAAWSFFFIALAWSPALIESKD